MSESTCIVLDPDAHRRAAGRSWQNCQRRCMRELAPLEVTLARGPEEARQATREAAMRGFEKIVVVGDAGTANGVVNGLMSLAPAHRARVKFGVLNLARPQPSALTLGLPQALRRQLEVLRAGHTVPIDVGLAEFADETGRRQKRHFLAGACFGVGPRMRHEWRRWRDRPLNGVSGVAGGLGGLLGRAQPWVRVEREGAEIYRGPWVAGLLMVGRYYPFYGQVAPQADPADGALDLVGLTGRVSLRALFRLLGASAFRRPRAWEIERGTRFSAGEIAGEVYLELDGLLVGRLPANFSVEARALSAIVPAQPARILKPARNRLVELRDRPVVASPMRVGQQR